MYAKGYSLWISREVLSSIWGFAEYGLVMFINISAMIFNLV